MVDITLLPRIAVGAALAAIISSSVLFAAKAAPTGVLLMLRRVLVVLCLIVTMIFPTGCASIAASAGASMA